MPKKNAIAGMHSIRLVDGRLCYHWKPSARLRRLGWRSLRLGTDYVEAAAAATQRNAEIRAGVEVRGGFDVALIRRRIARMERHRRWLERALAALRGQLASAKGRRSKVYFVATMKGPIKIGYSFDPENRVRTMQTNHAKPLRILALVDGGPNLEAEYHSRFAAHRLRGEWFVAHADILEEIRRINEGALSNGPASRMALSNDASA